MIFNDHRRRYQSFRRFTQELEAHAAELQRFYQEIHDIEAYCFHPLLVDWHAIAGQLPEVHRHFARPQDNAVRRRLAASQAGVVPWLYGRD